MIAVLAPFAASLACGSPPPETGTNGGGPEPETPAEEQTKAEPEPKSNPDPEPEPPTFDATTISEIDARIVTVYDDHWSACGVIHSVGAVVVEVLGVGEPRPQMVLFISCPVDAGRYKLLEAGKQVTVELHAKKQGWPRPPDAFPKDLPVRYVKTLSPWLGPTPDPITHPCVVTAAQFDRELEEGDRSCTSPSDCECFPGGITKKAGCGGVTGGDSARKLHALASEFREDECKLVQQCAAQVCAPRCVDGQCTG